MTLQEILDAIDNAATPEKMSQAEAADFYEEIENHCDTAARALRSEMGDDD